MSYLVDRVPWKDGESLSNRIKENNIQRRKEKLRPYIVPA